MSIREEKIIIENNDDDDDMPDRFCQIRDSERKVKDSFYLTVSTLAGHGLSLAEACHAIVEIGNTHV